MTEDNDLLRWIGPLFPGDEEGRSGPRYNDIEWELALFKKLAIWMRFMPFLCNFPRTTMVTIVI